MNTIIVRKILIVALVLSTVLTFFSVTTHVAQAQQVLTGPRVEYAWAFKMDFPNDTLQAKWWLIERTVTTSESLPHYDIEKIFEVDVSQKCEILGASIVSSERFVFDGTNYIQCRLPSFVQQAHEHFDVRIDLRGQNAEYWVAAQINPDAGQLPTAQTLIDGALLGSLYHNNHISQGVDPRNTLRILTTEYTVPVSNYYPNAGGEFKYVSGFGTHFLFTLNDVIDFWGGVVPIKLLNASIDAGDHGYMYWDSHGESHAENSWTAPAYGAVGRLAQYTLTFGCNQAGAQCFKGTAKSFIVDPGIRGH